MVAAGESLVAGRFPGERIGTSIRTSSVSTFTAETEVQTISVGLIAGRTYKVVYRGTVQSTVAGDSARSRIREDSVTGTQLNSYRVDVDQSGAGYSADIEAEYTPAADETKTFSVTAERAAGTGSLTAAAAGTQPCYLYVDYVRG
jgi:hypothetical protein